MIHLAKQVPRASRPGSSAHERHQWLLAHDADYGLRQASPSTVRHKMLMSPRMMPAQGGGGGTYFQQLPVGYTTFIDESFASMPASPFVEDYKGFGGTLGKVTSITDLTAPYSGPKVAQGLFQAGDPWGSAPFNYGFDCGVGQVWKNLYTGFIIKWSANFTNNAPGAGTKLFWPAGDEAQGGATYYTLNGNSMDFGVVQQGGPVDPNHTDPNDPNYGGREMYANLSGAVGTLFSQRDSWVHLEVILKANTSNTTFDGELHIWINGTKTHEYPRSVPHGGSAWPNAGINWQMDSANTGTRRWLSLGWEPTWGGSGTNVPFDQYEYIDHVKFAGSNL